MLASGLLTDALGWLTSSSGLRQSSLGTAMSRLGHDSLEKEGNARTVAPFADATRSGCLFLVEAWTKLRTRLH